VADTRQRAGSQAAGSPGPRKPRGSHAAAAPTHLCTVIIAGLGCAPRCCRRC
jgi:hypothetical protein